MAHKGLTILPETTELAILARIREEVGEEGDLVDRLVQDPMNVEVAAGEILLSVAENNRVLVIEDTRGLAALEQPRSNGMRVGFYPIPLLTLILVDKEFCRRLMRTD